MKSLKTRFIDRKPLRDTLYEAVSLAIVAGELKPGDRVQDTELAQQYGASRTPVREALLRLVEHGFLINEPRKGFRVAPMTRDEVFEIYELITLLEVRGLQATGAFLPEQFEAMERIEQQLLKTQDGAIERLRLDELWHQELLRNSPNRRMQRMLLELRRLATRYEAFYFVSDDLLKHSLAEHHSIRALIASGKSDGAAEALEAHWIRCRDALLESPKLNECKGGLS